MGWRIQSPWGGGLAALLLALTACGCGGPDHARLSLPAPPGSQLPHLAVRPDGAPVLSWVEPFRDGHRLAFAVLEDGTWGAPRTAAHGSDWFVNWADVPSVVPLHDGLWAAHWLVKRPGGMYAYDIAMATSVDGGLTWSEPFQPHDDNTPTEHGFVSLWPARTTDGAPAVGAVWLDGRHMLLDPAVSAAHDPRTTLRSAIFEANGNAHRATEVDPRVCDCCQTAAASVDDGVVIAYRDRSAGENRDIAVASGRAGNWQRGGLVARDGWTITGCPVNGPATAAHDGATAVAWFTDADGARRVRVARRMSGDPAWSAPVDVSRDTLGRVDVTWLGDAALAVSWLAETNAGQAAILVARVDSAGQVGSPVAVATTRAARPAGFPRLVAHHDELLVAWTRWQDEQPRVVVSHLANRALTAGF